MEKELNGLTPIDPYEMAVFTARMMRKTKGHVTTREEVLRMQNRAGREWSEEEIEGILAANDEA